jgi:hypothetical protein
MTDDPLCPASEYRWMKRGGDMELWGLSLGAVALAVWRYFFDIDWDLRVKRRRRRKEQSGG